MIGFPQADSSRNSPPGDSKIPLLRLVNSHQDTSQPQRSSNFQGLLFYAIAQLSLDPLLSSSSMSPKSDSSLLTERDQLFLVECIKNSKEKLVPDFDLVAQATSMSKKGAA
jgi:hypothetical protein